MATVNAGPAGPINMLGLQLSNLQYGNVPIYDAGLVRVDDGGGQFVDFHGSFSYPAAPPGGGTYGYMYDAGMGAPDPSAYYPSAGTISQITENAPGGVSLDVNGLAVDAPSFFAMAQAHNADAMLNAVFAGSDQFNGSAGGDWIDGFGGDDIVAAGAGDDSVRGLDGNDTIDGEAGNDDLNGNKGQDVVRGGSGSDFVRGGQGDDTVSGGDGDDVHVNGNIGADVVHGDAGNDQVFGGQDQDHLFGDDGNDTLSGDLGNDTLTGGAGADRFLFRAGSGQDLITDFSAAEGDRIQLAAGQAFTLTSVGGQAVIDLGNGDQLTLAGVSQASSDWIVVV